MVTIACVHGGKAAYLLDRCLKGLCCICTMSMLHVLCWLIWLWSPTHRLHCLWLFRIAWPLNTWVLPILWDKSPTPQKYDNPDFRWHVTTMCGQLFFENRDDIEFLSDPPDIGICLVANHTLSTARRADEGGDCNYWDSLHANLLYTTLQVYRTGSVV